MQRIYTLAAVLFTGIALPSVAISAPISLSFESGTLAGLTFSGQGNAFVTNAVGGLTPLFGTNMAILSNGPGDQSGNLDAAVLLSDLFTLTNADTLAVSIRRLTAEFTGAASDPGRLDFFQVNLLDGAGGLAAVLHSSTVGDLSFVPIPGAPVSTLGGDTFFEATPWNDLSITGLTGNFRMQFVVQDGGDNSFDSALLIDAANAGTTAVPEPTTLSMVSLIGLLALWRASRRA